jgi:uncharacterized protein YbjT (DUF2867 family)
VCRVGSRSSGFFDVTSCEDVCVRFFQYEGIALAKLLSLATQSHKQTYVFTPRPTRIMMQAERTGGMQRQHQAVNIPSAANRGTMPIIWCMMCALATAAPQAPPVVVSGATGRVGSAVVRALIARRGSAEGIFVIARDGAKAISMHGSRVQCLMADIGEVDCMDFESVPDGFHLFVACNNSPIQAQLEENLCRAACSAGCSYIVKLSTATPVLEAAQGGPHAAHLQVEALLADELDIPHAVLRPNLFMDEVLSDAFLGLCEPLRTGDKCEHPFADAPISMVDVRDVAECASALLCRADATELRDGLCYDITGPSAVRLGVEVATAISAHRSRPISITPCTIEEYLEPRGLPHAAARSLAGFLNVLKSRCAATSNAVLELTGRSPRSVEDYIRDHADDFLCAW